MHNRSLASRSTNAPHLGDGQRGDRFGRAAHGPPIGMAIEGLLPPGAVGDVIGIGRPLPQTGLDLAAHTLDRLVVEARLGERKAHEIEAPLPVGRQRLRSTVIGRVRHRCAGGSHRPRAPTRNAWLSEGPLPRPSRLAVMLASPERSAGRARLRRGNARSARGSATRALDQKSSQAPGGHDLLHLPDPLNPRLVARWTRPISPSPEGGR